MKFFNASAARGLGLALLILLGVLLSTARAAEPWNIDALMTSMATSQPENASFVEKKYIAMLERPIESSGKLRYRAPDVLEKHTLRPQEERLVIQGNVLRITRKGKQHVVQLAQYPELEALMASIQGMLGGNRQMLEQFFKLQLTGTAAQWTLQLTPLAIEVGRNIHLIKLAGVAGRLRQVDIIQTDGDRTVMQITPDAR